MLEPEKNPNPSIMVDPPLWLRYIIRKRVDGIINPKKREARRRQAEARRVRRQEPHVIEYFHQLDDPYSHLAAQSLSKLTDRYDVVLKPHLIHATGGKDQPEQEKLARWAQRDAELIAPHYGMSFPEGTGITPQEEVVGEAAGYLSTLSPDEFVSCISDISSALWLGDTKKIPASVKSPNQVSNIIAQGSARLKELGHYSGAMFYYAGEWYWGIDRLFFLEERLRELGVCRSPDEEFIAPRPEIEVSGVDASSLRLEFYPSLNSPYTAIIYDKVIELKSDCRIDFHHKPVLPMIMRGVPATRAKADYIFFDTKREAEFLGVPFGPMITPIGTPVRRAYSLMPWAMSQGKDQALLSKLLKCAFSEGVALHSEKGLRHAVESAGLDWHKAKQILGTDEWKPMIEQFQDEMVEGLGLWGVPSFRLSGTDGEPDLAVWGQDRLWLIAAEIRRRAE